MMKSNFCIINLKEDKILTYNNFINLYYDY